MRRLSYDEKLQELGNAATYRVTAAGSGWSRATAYEILVASLRLSERVPRKFIAAVFDEVGREADLLEPVERWLTAHTGMGVMREVALANRTADVMGFRALEEGFLRKRKVPDFVAVELKNDLDEFKRGFDQMAKFALYAHRVYVACTPGLAIDWLIQHAGVGKASMRWDGTALDQVLSDLGFGLLLVEGQTATEVLPPRVRQIHPSAVDTVIEAIDKRYGRPDGQ